MAGKQQAWAPPVAGRGERARLARALDTCTTEADVVQVLYARLSHVYGFDVIDLQVLERDGWCRRTVVDHGVLQDTRRFPVADSYFASHYSRGVTAVGHPLDARQERGRGPGRPTRIRTHVWVPIRRRRRLIGAVVYEMTAFREPPEAVLDLLEKVHAGMGAVVNRASLNELTHRPNRDALIRALATCATEADVVQVLYAQLRTLFGYDAVNMQVLEREGWCHRVIVDQGVLQDVRRLPLAESYFAEHFNQGVPVVGHFRGAKMQYGRGPGTPDQPRTYIWVPVRHRGQMAGAVVYQTRAHREIPPEELAFLQDVHVHLGAVVSSAYLHELTRNQALSLSALNEIGRALATTQDEEGVVSAVAASLSPHIPTDLVELIVPDQKAGTAHVLRAGPHHPVSSAAVGIRSPSLAQARQAISAGRPVLALEGVTTGGYEAGVWLPLGRGSSVEAVLAVRSHQPEAYEESTITFLTQVADQVSLALHNAWSYAALDSQRRRLEVVEAVGRRLASALDRWSIMRTLRAELARHLEFDVFSLAIIEETDGGLVAEGHVNDSGEEQPPVSIPLAAAGPSRQAYESGRPVVIQRSPWSRRLKASGSGEAQALLATDGALLQVTPGMRRRRRASASIVWVPVPHAGRIRALLSVQSYRYNAFGDWHVTVLQDVAAHVSLALATADQVARMTAILQYSPVGVLLEDGSGRILFANNAIERIYGVRGERLLGLPANRLPQLAGAVPLADPGAEEGGPQQLRLPAAGTTVEVRRVQIPGSVDHPAGTLSLHEDITRERMLQDARDLMLRAVGHEVRSPAAAMRSTLATLLHWRDVMPSEKREALIDQAYSQSERLLRLAEAQLIIGKLETRDYEPNSIPIPMLETLNQVLSLLRSRYGGRAGQVRTELPDELPPACCEPPHLEQVLVNLIGNALEHTKASEVVVSGERQGAWLRVGVLDNGPGLPAERMERLFERGAFAGGHRAHGGLGLGLYLLPPDRRALLRRPDLARAIRPRRHPGTELLTSICSSPTMCGTAACLAGCTSASIPPSNARYGSTSSTETEVTMGMVATSAHRASSRRTTNRLLSSRSASDPIPLPTRRAATTRQP
ncbi:MAG: GAF domain-containing protein [Candidatus Dormibacteraeota bacterium]|nr:GAF domain-containing protein [Candidatus Dormibacteraeota bacterium]